MAIGFTFFGTDEMARFLGQAGCELEEVHEREPYPADAAGAHPCREAGRNAGSGVSPQPIRGTMMNQPPLDVILKRFDTPDELRRMVKGKFKLARPPRPSTMAES